MAALLKGQQKGKFCGGALITDSHVVTAAHCLAKVQPTDLMIRLGAYDFSAGADETSTDHRVSQIRIHPGYNDKTTDNDIAVIVLRDKARIGDAVKPICLPQERRDYSNSRATVIGFGAEAYGGRGSQKLKEVDLPVWDNTRCSEKYAKLPGTRLCAGGDPNGGKDSCQGDSGGPLMVQGPSQRWMLVGVVSYGLKCGEPGIPGVYTRVTEYNRWILEQVKQSGNGGRRRDYYKK